MRLLASLIAVGLTGCAGCGGGGDDAPLDATPLPDIDNGSCGDQLRFTGEYVDWDSGAAFCGIFEATFTARDDGPMDSTAPNGRFDTCIPRDAAQVVFDIAPPAAASECTSPPSTYPLPGLAIATPDVILAGGFWSGRNLTMDRLGSLGVTLDPTKAHVFVHVDGTPRAVTVAAAHDAPQARNADTWAAGDTGSDVFFPNVEVGGGQTTVSVDGGATGAGDVPVEAGTITNVSVIAR